MSNLKKQKIPGEIYNRLFAFFGPQHWWPADHYFEMMVGAILTQSAAWTSVEKGLDNLKREKVLSPPALRNLSQNELADLIHPCGYYNAKAVKLKAFTAWFGERYGDDLKKMCATDLEELRKELLEVHGVGEETADSILLYACNKPIFVIDAYSRRIIDRLGLSPRRRKYSDYQQLFMRNLPADVPMFNEYHALLVALGKDFCRKKPVCEKCCLKDMCKTFNPVS